jgi:hypothetical protein
MALTLTDPWHSAILLALVAIWALLLFGGFAFGRVTPDRTRRMPTWTRMGSSFTLVVMAWYWYSLTRELPVGIYALLIAVGMSFGLLGDLLLASVIPLAQPVLAGILAFGLGHGAYLLATVFMGNRFGLHASLPRFGMLVVWELVGLSGWYIFVFQNQKPTILHWAALPYALLLASVAGLFTGLAIQSGAFAPAAVGAALFLASDLILATQLFNGGTFPLIGDVIWLTYGPAQFLIVDSVAAAFLQK